MERGDVDSAGRAFERGADAVADICHAASAKTQHQQALGGKPDFTEEMDRTSNEKLRLSGPRSADHDLWAIGMADRRPPVRRVNSPLDGSAGVGSFSGLTHGGHGIARE